MSKSRKNTALHVLDKRGGRYHAVPNAVADSVSFQGLSPYAQALLYGLVRRFTGYNNGKIGYSSREMSKALGGCHHTKVQQALGELLDGGFVAREERFAKIERKADEWRLTFVSSGPLGHVQPATNEYKDRVPPNGKWKQKRAEKASAARAESAETASSAKKQSVEASSTRSAGTTSFESDAPAENASTHIFYHPLAALRQAKTGSALGGAGLDDADLRAFAHDYLRSTHEMGAQSRVAKAAGVPAGTLSRFLAGGKLPSRHRLNLQTAIGARWPFNEYMARKSEDLSS